MHWTRETVVDLAAERRRREQARERHQERLASARLYPRSGNVVYLRPRRTPRQGGDAA